MIYPFREQDMMSGAYVAAVVEECRVALFGRLCHSIDRGLLRPDGTWYGPGQEIRSFTLLNPESVVNLRVKSSQGNLVNRPVNWVHGGDAKRQDQVWACFRSTLAPELRDHLDQITQNQPFGGLGALMLVGGSDNPVACRVVGMMIDYGQVAYQLQLGPKLPSQPYHDIAALTRRWTDPADRFTVHFRAPGLLTEVHTAFLG